jgi:hypothetical protein
MVILPRLEKFWAHRYHRNSLGGAAHALTMLDLGFIKDLE